MSDITEAPCFICRCEEITAGTILQAIEEGARTINDVKRRTRAGMGVCQGAYCVRPMAELIEHATGAPVSQIAPMTARPPVRLVPLGLLAAMEE